MRLLLALVALAGCGNKSKLDVDRGADVDVLWDLAPDGTELGIVASPRAVELAFRGIAAVRSLTAQPDVEPAKDQLDALAHAMFGSTTATPEEAGFATNKPFAMFATSDGVLGIMPVGDRDKFMAQKKGTRGSAEDTLDTNTCRMISDRYVCATTTAMFDRLGKGSLRGKLGPAGARGDAELYMANKTLLGDTKGTLTVAAEINKGEVSLHGIWQGTPSGVLAKVSGITAPHPDTTGASGFVTFNAAPLLANLPSIPIAGGVTTDQLAASMVGPISAVIPAGSIDIQIHIPLKDAKPATTIVENCKDVGTFFALAEKQTPGACRVVLQGTNALELDIWVEGTTLRLGAHKGASPKGLPGALTPVARDLAANDWTAALWGRGTMLNLSGITPTTQEVPAGVALGIHMMGLVNELGAAAKVDATGVRFRGYVRTVWTNTSDVVTKYVAVSGNDIISGKATEAGKSLAATAPGSQFAADFAAGQGGLMVPAAAIGIVTSVVMPAIARLIGGETGEAQPDGGDAGANPNGPPMANADLAQLLCRAYVEEAYPKWLADNKGKKCPTRIDDLAKYFGDDPGIPIKDDPWGRPLVMTCSDDKGVTVMSVGEDGVPATADDVHAP
jgi:hypothetical protein